MCAFGFLGGALGILGGVGMEAAIAAAQAGAKRTRNETDSRTDVHGRAGRGPGTAGPRKRGLEERRDGAAGVVTGTAQRSGGRRSGAGSEAGSKRGRGGAGDLRGGAEAPGADKRPCPRRLERPRAYQIFFALDIDDVTRRRA